MLHFDMSMDVDNIMPLALLEEKVDKCYQAMEDYYNYNGGLGIRIFEDYLEGQPWSEKSSHQKYNRRFHVTLQAE